jgi:hypothetical protein
MRVTGDEVRDTWFLPGGGWWGGGSVPEYLASDVDGLLRRVAAELDAERPAGPLIENTVFRSGKGGRRMTSTPWTGSWTSSFSKTTAGPL